MKNKKLMNCMVTFGCVALAMLAFSGTSAFGQITNATCDTASPLAVPSGPTQGDTNPNNGAVNGGLCGGFGVGGNFYTVVGDGNTITASLCTNELVNDDAAMELFCNSCADPICVANSEDVCGGLGFSPELSWCSEAGTTYFIAVGDNFLPQDTFNIDITTDGTPCTGAPVCATTCGDGVAEGNEECDGADAAACGGLGCQADCTCVPPSCGDNTINQASEQCDGTDDAACPGQCIAAGQAFECTCPAVCGDNFVSGAEECDPPGAVGQCGPFGAGGQCQADCSCPTAPAAANRPALPAWGLVGLGLVLLAGLLVVFGRRRTVSGI